MKNTIVYLSRTTEESMRQLIYSISLLKRNFLPWSPADIIIFHEDGYDTQTVKKAVGDLGCGMDIKFSQVDFSRMMPGFEGLTPGQRGYRHMCHFFANDIFLRDELACYERYMRLDVDSYILSPVKYNIFERMAQKGWKYVYRMEMKEHATVAKGLREAAEAYFSSNPSCVRNHPAIKRLKLYYTNFEICDLEFFRSEPWQKYFGAIDATGGIWRHRWGDAPIRWLGIKYLMRPSEVHCMRDMSYFHQFRLRKWLTFRLPLEYFRYGVHVYGIELPLPTPEWQSVKI